MMVYMTYFKHPCNIITVFVLGYLSTAILFFFYGKALAIVTKCSILDVAGVLNPCQYEHGLHMEITLFKF